MNTIPFHISTESELAVPLRRAILLYQHARQVCATVHDITIEDNVPIILPGCAVHGAAVHELARALGERAEPPSFLPPELLWYERQQLLWWLPPGRRHTLFRVPEFGGELAGVLPHPGLVFFAAPGRWLVWAVKGRGRPRPASRLWRAPYLNVYRNGQICEGSGELPGHFAVERLEDWNRAFFASAFSHLADSEPLLDYEGGPGAFWRAMLAGHFERFPSRVLVPSAAGTLAQLLTTLQGGHHDRR